MKRIRCLRGSDTGQNKKQKKHIKGTLRDNTALKAQRLTCW